MAHIQQADIQTLVRQPQGMRVIRHLVRMAGVLSASYATKDSLAMAYNEGRRSMGLSIIQLVQFHAPERLGEVLGCSERQLGPAYGGVACTVSGGSSGASPGTVPSTLPGTLSDTSFGRLSSEPSDEFDDLSGEISGELSGEAFGASLGVSSTASLNTSLASLNTSLRCMRGRQGYEGCSAFGDEQDYGKGNTVITGDEDE